MNLFCSGGGAVLARQLPWNARRHSPAYRPARPPKLCALLGCHAPTIWLPVLPQSRPFESNPTSTCCTTWRATRPAGMWT